MPSVPAGTRYYAIGDVHGRSDLFGALVAAIDADDEQAGSAKTTIVLLGDLVDRGADSAGVVQAAIDLAKRRPVILLIGNHEEMFLDSFSDTGVLRHFLRHGGRETVLSYGIPRDRYDDATLEELQGLMAEFIPASHRSYLKDGLDQQVAGDYLFVHAGISPGVPLDEQKPHHLRWIREPFLEHAGMHELFVVHGHTITDDIDSRANRIGIDTGAYRSGRLTALVLEGTSRRLIQAVEGERGIEIENRDCS